MIEVVLLNEAARLLEELDEGVVGVLDVLPGDGGTWSVKQPFPSTGQGRSLPLAMTPWARQTR